MLRKLKIKNIALISESTIEFQDGLNILTGETGAGKSLIIDSLNFVLGARADKTLIKTGEDFAYVEAVFLLDDIGLEIKDFFNLINTQPDNTIIISRYLNVSGKSEIKVNGEYVSNSILKKLSGNLVDIHGQHTHQSILDVKNHLYILDSFNNLTINLKNKLKEQFSKLNEINNSINKIGGDGAEREKNIELYKYQIAELENSKLNIDEEEKLISNKQMMLNAEQIFQSIEQINNCLSDKDYNALSLVKQSLNNFSGLLKYDEKLTEYYNKLEGSYYEILDISEILKDKKSNLNFSENELTETENRLELIKSLKRKYKCGTIQELLNYLADAETQLNSLINSDTELAKLKDEKSKILNEIYNTCVSLTNERKETADIIKNKVLLQLKQLGMKNSNFDVVFNNDYELNNIEQKATLNGSDNIEFMFSANLGEPVKPLAKIISGGEMSRFMLAIKCVVNEKNNKTFVFDEIDNGIGGVTGTIVAEKLSLLSKYNQVICVTHLAQIAGFADNHYKIFKLESNGKTYTNIVLLKENNIVEEIARLLGASKDSQIAKLHATQLLEESKNKKNKI